MRTRQIQTLFFLLLIVCYQASNAQCISSGSKNGSIFSNNNTTGSVSWTNPSNTITSNGISALSMSTVDSGTTFTTNYLFVKNFGFSIPTNAVVCGITVKAEHRQQGADGNNTFVTDNTVFLLKNSNISGSNHAFPFCWTSYYANIVHGSISDTWGTTWTAADINSPNFGVAISAKLQSNCCHQTLSAEIDHVSVTVFYTIPLPIGIVDFQLSSSGDSEVSVNWSTLTENNSSSFKIERSNDAYNWTEINEVPSANYSNHQINYSSLDQSPHIGTSYYRIQQIDLDGTSYYSDVESINIDKIENISIKYDPVAAYIQINTTEGTSLHVSLLDQSGRIVKSITNNSSQENIRLNTDDISTGIYIVLIESNGEYKVQKLSI